MTELNLNGTRVAVGDDLTRPLLDVLRDEIGDLTPKPGCREGRCGACTVLVDGAPVASCLVPVGRVADAQITAVEGLGNREQLDPVQQAFENTGAVQCGICTTGMMLTVRAMADEQRTWTRREIQRALANNLCRCTGYTKILDATEQLLAGEEPTDG